MTPGVVHASPPQSQRVPRQWAIRNIGQKPKEPNCHNWRTHIGLRSKTLRGTPNYLPIRRDAHPPSVIFGLTRVALPWATHHPGPGCLPDLRAWSWLSILSPPRVPNVFSGGPLLGPLLCHQLKTPTPNTECHLYLPPQSTLRPVFDSTQLF
uniref:Uncharacterized protein n=1 Tax=Cercocebus atys TaxID=9531 RepID=A0A2K5KYV4_CERAT